MRLTTVDAGRTFDGAMKALLWLSCLCAFLGSVATTGLVHAIALFLAIAVVGAASAMGAATLASRRGLHRPARLLPRAMPIRSALWGAGTALLLATFCMETPVGRMVAAVPFGLAGGLLGSYLSPAESAFVRADRMLKAGKVQAARRALQDYLRDADQDPLRAARQPTVEAFLAGERDTLDLSLELEAAPAPAGRGTEMVAASEPGEPTAQADAHRQPSPALQREHPAG